MLLFFIILLLTFGAGLFFLFRFFPVSIKENSWLWISLGMGWSLGIASFTYYSGLLFLSYCKFNPLLFDIILSLIFLGITGLFFLKKKSLLFSSKKELSSEKINLIILILFLAVLFSALGVEGYYLFHNSSGAWDAWAIWNYHARILNRAGPEWTTIISHLEWSHPDYPLLLPGLIAKYWKYLQVEASYVPQLLASIFTLITVGLLYGGLVFLKGKNMALLASLILLGTPFFLIQGATQYADTPLGFYYLATCFFIAGAGLKKNTAPIFLIMAGATAGFAGWTKNEGILFAIIILFLLIIKASLFQEKQKSFQPFLFFLGGIAPFLSLIAYFKLKIAPASDLTALQNSSDIIAKLTDPSRYLLFFQVSVSHFINFGQWSKGFLIIFILSLLLFGFKTSFPKKKTASFLLLLLSLTLSGYFFIYIITPHPLIWQIETSLDRLLIQLWPSFIFAIFLRLKDPFLEKD